MFEKNGNRYLTKGVNERLPKAIQCYCWQLIDEKRKEVEIIKSPFWVPTS